MDFLQKIKESPYFHRLKGSVQYRYDLKNLRIIGICFTIAMVPMLWAFVMLMKTENPAAVFVFFYLLLLAGMILYYFYRWLGIFLYIEHYQFFQATLDQPFVQGRGGVGFLVEFTDRHGNRLQRKTSPMFSSQWEPLLEEYNNQTVLLAYNEKTDRLVLIQRV